MQLYNDRGIHQGVVDFCSALSEAACRVCACARTPRSTSQLTKPTNADRANDSSSRV